MKSSFACLLLLHAGLSLAQSTPGQPLATRAEYKDCLDKADELAAGRKALQTRKADHDGAVRQLQEDVAQHVAAGATLNDKKKNTVEAYNAQGAALNARRDQLNANVAQFDQDVAEHNRRGTQSNQKCSGMKISREDREAVMKERAERGAK